MDAAKKDLLLKEYNGLFFYDSNTKLEDVNKFFNYNFSIINGKLSWHTSDDPVIGWGSIPINSWIQKHTNFNNMWFTYREGKSIDDLLK